MEHKKTKVTKAQRVEAFHMRKERVDELWSAFKLELERHKCNIWFDVFLKENGKTEKIISGGEEIDSSFLAKLMENHENIFVPIDHRGDIKKYIDKFILDHIDDSTLSVNDKSKALYNNSTQIVKELFEKPVSKTTIHKAKESVSKVVNSILDGHITLSSLLEVSSYDYYTYTHSVDVAVYSVALGKSLGLDDAMLLKIGEAAILHDIGKTKIDINIVNKNGKLTDEEFEEMKKHSQYGYEILKEMGETQEHILLGALQHHEKLDGMGYPKGLKGVEINPIAMIISCADIFDALTTKRSYKKALSSFEALEIMEKQMAAGLNIKLLKKFILMMGKKII